MRAYGSVSEYRVASLVWYVRTYVRTARTRVNQFGGHLPTMPPLPCLSLCARQHAWHLLSKGNTCATVVALLQKEGIVTTRQTVWRLERHVLAHSTIEPRPKTGRRLLWDIRAIDDGMEGDDETTSTCLSKRQTV